jgi:hypothetical protein
MTPWQSLDILSRMIRRKPRFPAGTRGVASATLLLVLAAQAFAADSASRRLDAGWEYHQGGLGGITQPLLWLKNEH